MDKIIKIIKNEKSKGFTKQVRDEGTIYVFSYDSYDEITGETTEAKAEVNLTELRYRKKILKEEIDNINQVLTVIKESL